MGTDSLDQNNAKKSIQDRIRVAEEVRRGASEERRCSVNDHNPDGISKPCNCFAHIPHQPEHLYAKDPCPDCNPAKPTTKGKTKP